MNKTIAVVTVLLVVVLAFTWTQPHFIFEDLFFKQPASGAVQESSSGGDEVSSPRNDEFYTDDGEGIVESSVIASLYADLELCQGQTSSFIDNTGDGGHVSITDADIKAKACRSQREHPWDYLPAECYLGGGAIDEDCARRVCQGLIDQGPVDIDCESEWACEVKHPYDGHIQRGICKPRYEFTWEADDDTVVITAFGGNCLLVNEATLYVEGSRTCHRSCELLDRGGTD